MDVRHNLYLRLTEDAQLSTETMAQFKNEFDGHQSASIVQLTPFQLFLPPQPEELAQLGMADRVFIICHGQRSEQGKEFLAGGIGYTDLGRYLQQGIRPGVTVSLLSCWGAGDGKTLSAEQSFGAHLHRYLTKAGISTRVTARRAKVWLPSQGTGPDCAHKGSGRKVEFTVNGGASAMRDAYDPEAPLVPTGETPGKIEELEELLYAPIEAALMHRGPKVQSLVRRVILPTLRSRAWADWQGTEQSIGKHVRFAKVTARKLQSSEKLAQDLSSLLKILQKPHR